MLDLVLVSVHVAQETRTHASSDKKLFVVCNVHWFVILSLRTGIPNGEIGVLRCTLKNKMKINAG